MGSSIYYLERIQKTFLHIILGDKFQSYRNALKLSGLDKLSDRRRKICLTFAKTSLKHEKFSNWFKPNLKITKTRLQQPKFCNVYSRTNRFERSPIIYLVKILNLHYATKKKWTVKLECISILWQWIIGCLGMEICDIDSLACITLFKATLITWQIKTTIIIIKLIRSAKLW